MIQVSEHLIALAQDGSNVQCGALGDTDAHHQVMGAPLGQASRERRFLAVVGISTTVLLITVFFAGGPGRTAREEAQP